MIQNSIVGTQKKSTLELGGKGANTIFEDAAIDQAVEGIINAIFLTKDMSVVQDLDCLYKSVAGSVIDKLKDRMSSLIVGDPLDKNTDIGAINSKEQLETINKYIKVGKEEGGEIYQPTCNLPSKGNCARQHWLLNVSQSHTIVQEEIFGPVLAIQTFRTIDEVIEKANNTPFGLSAGVWTEKGAKIFKLTQELNVGVVWANTYNKFDSTFLLEDIKRVALQRRRATWFNLLFKC